MQTYVVRSSISPLFREAHFKALEGDGKLFEDISPYVTAHLEYLRALKAKGEILCGGPMVDFTWGLLVLRADSIEEVKGLLEKDPAKKHGLLLEYEIIPWYHMV